jgi:sugar phosphate isomerase/epimerase
MNRRDFLKSSLAIVPSASYFSFDENNFRKKNIIGLQLYTLREEMRVNPEKTLAALREIGYQKVESAYYNSGKIFGIRVKDFRRFLINEGIKMPSGHIDTGQAAPTQTGTIINNFEKAVEEAVSLGQKYLVCGYTAEFERKTLDDYKKLAELFNKAGEICKNYSIQFCYHNHDFEFEPIHSVVPYDLLLRECDDELVKMELDLYWITKAGKKPLSYFEQYPLRFPLWHVKDMAKEDTRNFAEVGYGKIDFASIFAHQEKAGLAHFFVAQDHCESQKPLESIAMSYNYLKNKNFINN